MFSRILGCTHCCVRVQRWSISSRPQPSIVYLTLFALLHCLGENRARPSTMFALVRPHSWRSGIKPSSGFFAFRQYLEIMRNGYPQSGVPRGLDRIMYRYVEASPTFSELWKRRIVSNCGTFRLLEGFGYVLPGSISKLPWRSCLAWNNPNPSKSRTGLFAHGER